MIEPPRTEVISGKTVTLRTEFLNHCIVKGNVFVIFANYLKKNERVPVACWGKVVLEKDVDEYLPDALVVCDEEKLKADGVYGAPDLVVEVLSNFTAFHDRGPKMRAYERHGVREYWIVEPVTQSVEQYVLENGRFALRDVYKRYEPEEFAELDEKERARVAPDFRCTLFDDLSIRLDDVFYRVRPGL